MIYLTIFLSKILENMLATLRIILVSNGKKKSGALLQGVVMLTWILVTGYTIVNLDNSVFKIIVFCLGSIVGSYLGSIIEEKIALGSVEINIISNKYKELYNQLKNYNITFNKNTISIITRRNNIPKIVNIIQNIDSNSLIITEKVQIYGKLTN